MAESNRGACIGCGRPKGECWVLPCLVLEVAMDKGLGAVKKWAGPGAIVKLNRPAKGGSVHAN